jgi:hypothetical protein
MLAKDRHRFCKNCLNLRLPQESWPEHNLRCKQELGQLGAFSPNTSAITNANGSPLHRGFGGNAQLQSPPFGNQNGARLQQYAGHNEPSMLVKSMHPYPNDPMRPIYAKTASKELALKYMAEHILLNSDNNMDTDGILLYTYWDKRAPNGAPVPHYPQMGPPHGPPPPIEARNANLPGNGQHGPPPPNPERNGNLFNQGQHNHDIQMAEPHREPQQPNPPHGAPPGFRGSNVYPHTIATIGFNPSPGKLDGYILRERDAWRISSDNS